MALVPLVATTGAPRLRITMSTTTAEPGRQSLLFLKRFLRNPREVGALCPSTRHLGRAMLDDLELGAGDVLVEYGAGTGSLTEAIDERLRTDWAGVRYLGIEREPGFCAVLRRRFPQLEFAEAQVEDVADLLTARNLPAPRAVISGLPLIFLPARRQIIEATAGVLAPGGTFRTFSYVQSYVTGGAREVRSVMRASFDAFTLHGPVLRNFPPAFVLRGDKSNDQTG
jgi:phosphatidylethanolamine/phosphatidyl-N-methylethanolamine N-methyltransferase